MNLNLYPGPLESPVRFFLIVWQGLLPSLCPEQRVGLRKNLVIFVWRMPEAITQTQGGIVHGQFTWKTPLYISATIGYVTEYPIISIPIQNIERKLCLAASQTPPGVFNVTYDIRIHNCKSEGTAQKSAGQGQAAKGPRPRFHFEMYHTVYVVNIEDRNNNNKMNS